MTVRSIICWVLQLLVAAILAPMILAKFSPAPEAVVLFEQLKMEPLGRYIVGALESLALLLLLIPAGAAWGAILGWGVMTGALIAHATVLGLGEPVPPLGMPLGVLAIVNWIGCALILVLRGKQIEFIRSMFPGEAESQF